MANDFKTVLVASLLLSRLWSDSQMSRLSLVATLQSESHFAQVTLCSLLILIVTSARLKRKEEGFPKSRSHFPRIGRASMPHEFGGRKLLQFIL